MTKTRKGRNGGTLMVWQPGISGNPNGRPRRLLSIIENKIGVDFNVSLSGNDKYQILESMLEMSLKELSYIEADPDTPAFMVIVARAIREDITRGTSRTMEALFDRFFGRAKQAIEHTGMNGTPVEFKGFEFLKHITLEEDR